MQVQHTVYPRILKEHFRANRGGNGSIVGKIKAISTTDNTLTLIVDQERNTLLTVQVDPKTNDISEFQGLTNEYIEVSGTVPAEGEEVFQLKQFCKFGSSFDLKTFNELVRLANQQFMKLFRNTE